MKNGVKGIFYEIEHEMDLLLHGSYNRLTLLEAVGACLKNCESQSPHWRVLNELTGSRLWPQMQDSQTSWLLLAAAPRDGEDGCFCSVRSSQWTAGFAVAAENNLASASASAPQELGAYQPLICPPT